MMYSFYAQSHLGVDYALVLSVLNRVTHNITVMTQEYFYT